MLFFISLLLSWTWPSHADGRACLDLFRQQEHFKVVRTADEIFTTQSAIGRAYAEVKLLKKAQLSSYEKISQIKKSKDFKKLEKYVKELMTSPLPAVLSPNGEAFIIDGHHDLYALVLMNDRLSDFEVALEVVKDYRSGGLSEENFYQDLLRRGWMDPDVTLKNHKTISELQDSPDRSLVGFSFSAISENFAVPMSGKHFVPRIQFKVADLARQENLFDFDHNLDNTHINAFTDLILTNSRILQFLVDSLNPDAAKKLRKFLNEKLMDASTN
jgi:hypothetical protein